MDNITLRFTLNDTEDAGNSITFLPFRAGPAPPAPPAPPASYASLLKDIEMYGYLTVVPVGVILNMLSLIVFLRWKSTAIGMHLRCLAVADTIVILFSFGLRTDVFWTVKLGIPQLTVLNVWVCKFAMYFFSVGFLSSGLILASATIERFLCVAFALRVKSWNLEKVSKILLFVYFVLAFGLSMYLMFVMEIIEFPDKKRCFYGDMEMYNLMFKITQTALSNGICGGTIFLFTILTAILLFRQKRARSHLFSKSSSRKELQITVMLLTITCLFIALRLPIIVAQELFLYHASLTPKLLVWWPLVNLLAVTNHSINFPVYLVFLKSFRRSLCEIFQCCKLKPTIIVQPNKENVATKKTVETATSISEISSKISTTDATVDSERF